MSKRKYEEKIILKAFSNERKDSTGYIV